MPDAAVHALVCGTCGAPLSAQKMRPLAGQKTAQTRGKRPKASKPAKPNPTRAAKTGDWGDLAAGLVAKQLKKKKKKKKKSGWKKVFDAIEDIFD
ncbi:hypothetical protein [Lyngbya sp. CCY1209]|uniref:hypothetical protein n=1 Tax=Lyngbya sp. CCY1209 TaxID=2886103 RepID=UPI002D216557|nr:hypothetical protein [Lyngbya sp. CCY1209]MEB3887234.1 hypothetical protein [Lyngbya sp. CCY1209]